MMNSESTAKVRRFLHLPVIFVLVVSIFGKASFVQSLLSLHLGVMFVEIGLVCWLLVGACPVFLRRVSVLLICVFAVYSLVAILNGESICGCFGSIATPPLFSFLIDLCLLVCLFLWVPLYNETRVRWHWLVSGATVILAVICAAFLVANPDWTYRAALVTGVAGRQSSLLEDAFKIGDQFPLDLVEDSGEMEFNGEWQVVFYKTDCPVCMKLINDTMIQFINSSKSVAFINVGKDDVEDKSVGRFHFLTLRDRSILLARAPMTVSLNDGVILSKAFPGRESNAVIHNIHKER